MLCTEVQELKGVKVSSLPGQQVGEVGGGVLKPRGWKAKRALSRGGACGWAGKQTPQTPGYCPGSDGRFLRANDQHLAWLGKPQGHRNNLIYSTEDLGG